MGVRIGIFFLILVFLLKAVPSSAQKPPPLPGLVPPGEINAPRGVKRNPERALEEFRKAFELFFNGRYDEALKVFNKVIKLDPYALEPYYWKGLIYLREGFLKKAEEMFKNYLEVKPAELRVIRALEEARRTVFPVLTFPESNYPKDYKVINPYVEVQKKKGLFSGVKEYFSFPLYNFSAMAIGPDENIYLTDYGSGKVVVLSKDGVPIRSWGGLKNPSGIAVSVDGRVYVSDFSQSKIFVFDLTGKLLKSFGDRELLNPQGIAIGPYGYLYVCDWGNHCVRRYTREGKYLRSLGRGYLWEPLAVCVDRKGNIWVSDGSERCIFKFGWDGLPEGKFLNDVFSRGLAVDFNDRILVCDEERNALFVIDGGKVIEKVNLSKASSLISVCGDSVGNVFFTDFDNPILFKISPPFYSRKIKIRISGIRVEKGSKRNAEIEVSEGWYPVPVERVKTSVRIIEDEWILEPTSVKEIDRPLAIGVVVDPAFKDEGKDLLVSLRDTMFVIDRAFVLGAFSSPYLPPNRWLWSEGKGRFDGKSLIFKAINLLITRNAERVLIYCGNPPEFSRDEMRRMAYFARLHQIRFYVFHDAELSPIWRAFIAYTGGKDWNIYYFSKNMPLIYYFRKSPFNAYRIRYLSLTKESRLEGKHYLRIFIETPFAHYEDEITYYVWGNWEKILR